MEFAAWVRVSHFLNALFLLLLIRSGIQILFAHPKLYWSDDCPEPRAWLRFTRKRVPTDRLWTSKDEEEPAPLLLALPGGHSLGLGRGWHFVTVVAWVLTGVAYVALLVTSGEWRRLVPTRPEDLTDAVAALLAYLRFELPPQGDPYDALQRFAYSGVVFVLAPLAIATGAAMSPAVGARFPRYASLFGGHQAARSLHFLTLIAFAAFTIVHTVLVAVHDPVRLLGAMVLGEPQADAARVAVAAAAALLVVIGANVAADAWSRRAPRAAQLALDAATAAPRRWLGRLRFRDRPGRRISPYFRVNGTPPLADPVYGALARDGFAAYRLEVTGRVGRPASFSLDELRGLPARTQLSRHVCIQGWTAVGEWTGVRVRDVLARCEPLAGARYVAFHGFDEKSETDAQPPGRYYEIIERDLAERDDAILAYEMNGAPLPIEHGAPLRLRIESQLGFKMVKYLRAIELVEDLARLGEGTGGWREDQQHYQREVSI